MQVYNKEQKMFRSEKQTLETIESKIRQCAQELTNTTDKMDKMMGVMNDRNMENSSVTSSFSESFQRVKEVIVDQNEACDRTDKVLSKTLGFLKANDISLLANARILLKDINDSRSSNIDRNRIIEETFKKFDESMRGYNTSGLSEEINKIKKEIKENEDNQPSQEDVLSILSKLRELAEKDEEDKNKRLQNFEETLKKISDMMQDGLSLTQIEERLQEMKDTVEESMKSVIKESEPSRKNREKLSKKMTVDHPDEIRAKLGAVEDTSTSESVEQKKSIEELTEELAECKKQLDEFKKQQNFSKEQLKNSLKEMKPNLSSQKESSTTEVMEKVKELKTSWTGGVSCFALCATVC